MTVLEDIEISRENVTNQAKEHINDNDLILTYSTSETLLQFFIEASKTIRFEVIVLETAPTYDGHRTAKLLAEAGIKTNLVQDSAVFAVMSRVDKVIISTHGVMANGGIIG
jgi:translation initiation factor eIF-2B subunit beta